MSQVQSTTSKLYKGIAELLVGLPSSEFSHIALDSGDMSAFDEDTNALATEITSVGLARAAADLSNETTVKTNDTAVAYHKFIASSDSYITGFGIFDAGSGGNLLLWCAFAATLFLESGDSLHCTAKIQLLGD